MMSGILDLRTYLNAALEKNATEMVIAPSEHVRYRQEKAWQVLDSAGLNHTISPAVTRQWAMQLCSEAGKSQLQEKGQVTGFWDFNRQKLYYEIYNSKAGILLQIQWLPDEWRSIEFWNFPKWVNESLTRGRGLHLMIAPEVRWLESATISFLQTVNSVSKAWTVWLKSEGLSHFKSDSALLTYHEHIPSSCDILILEGFENLALAVEESEKGRGVVLMLQHHHLHQCLQRALTLVSPERFASQMKLALNLRAIFGIEGWVSAYDLLANTTSVEECLRSGNLSALEKQMKDADKDTGMRTMNQALLQLILRRKIDFKKGFEVSSAPVELDGLLKQIGI